MTTPYPSEGEKDGTPSATPEGSGKMAWKLIGQILVEKGYTTFEQVFEARRIDLPPKYVPPSVLLFSCCVGYLGV